MRCLGRRIGDELLDEAIEEQIHVLRFVEDDDLLAADRTTRRRPSVDHGTEDFVLVSEPIVVFDTETVVSVDLEIRESEQIGLLSHFHFELAVVGDLEDPFGWIHPS